MKKISIITPVYNEENTLPIYFDAVKKIDYPKDDFEIVFVNDGSNDKSLSVLHTLKNENKDINIKIVDLGKNRGRAISRYTGAQEAAYNDLFFLDTKCELFPDALNIINKKNYQPIIGHVIQKKDSYLDIFFFLVRRKLYKQANNDSFDDLYFNEKSFDQVPKGTGILFIDRQLFLDSQIDNLESKNSSDDTKLLKNIVSKKDILKTKDFKVYYNIRTSFRSSIIHMFNRGPKFIDYYYTPRNKYFWIVNLSLVCFLIIIALLFIGYFKPILLVLFIGLFAISLYFSKNIKEVGIIFLMFPVIYLTFMAGRIKGLFLKSCGKL